jgi:hypothetical protein
MMPINHNDHPLPPPEQQAEEVGTRWFLVVDGENKADGGGR